MSLLPHQLELLSPARDADIGIEAVNHGADAVYIGGPAFGARASAGNDIRDIERLVKHAHRFNSRIFITLNTILRQLATIVGPGIGGLVLGFFGVGAVYAINSLTFLAIILALLVMVLPVRRAVRFPPGAAIRYA